MHLPLLLPLRQVYRRAGLLREALALAAARLLPGHPLLLVRRVAGLSGV